MLYADFQETINQAQKKRKTSCVSTTYMYCVGRVVSWYCVV